MISSNRNRLFGPGGCLTAVALQNYANGSLPVKDRLRVEEHIKICELCAEALQGFKKHVQNGSVNTDLRFLSRRIRRRFSSPDNETGRRIYLSTLFTMAALLLILIGFFFILRQNSVYQGRTAPRADSTVNAVNALQDSSGVPGQRDDSDQIK